MDKLIPVTHKTPLRHRFWRWFYDRFAFAYDAVLDLADLFHLGSEGRIRREVISHSSFLRDATVLDLGCGTASSLPFLPKEAAYIGVDLSGSMLQRAKAKSRGRTAYFVQADACALPFKSSTMGFIVAMGALQHVAFPQVAIEECRRVSRPKAHLLLVDERHAERRLLAGLDHSHPPRYISEYFVLELET